MKILSYSLAVAISLLLPAACSRQKDAPFRKPLPDTPFIQDYSVKYDLSDPGVMPEKVLTDRNGAIQIFSSHGLLCPRAGAFLFPGTLVSDVHDRQTSDKQVQGMTLYRDQLVYIDDKAIFSNSWAGKLYLLHDLPGARILAGGKDFCFLVAEGSTLNLVSNSGKLWEGSLEGEKAKDILYDAGTELFWILGESSLYTFSPARKELSRITCKVPVTCIGLASGQLVAGTNQGFLMINTSTKRKTGELKHQMPWPELTCICEIKGNLWFGSTRGAMMLCNDGKYNYYASERWLPSDTVVSISGGPENSVLVLTTEGLAKICFEEMNLSAKAAIFGKQVRERHIRNGFNATLSGMKKGDVTTGSLEDSDNDGLWTSMYLAAETFRYAVTKSGEALQNIRESLDATERLYTINSLNSGFPSRSFLRRGYKYNDPAWRRATDPEWDWKSTTSSDEAIGHIFAFGAIAELVDVRDIRNKAVVLIDTLMSHIVKNNFYLIDWDGKPTLWGKWNPEYVNGFPEMVGDRKLNSSNIIAMLQTAYHFTGKDKYKNAAYTLMFKHGYLDNLMRPMKEIGMAPPVADDWSKMLSESWNHSDDEMYYCGYWGLYRYAFNDSLKTLFREAIIDHYESELPEKEGLWIIMTAIAETGREDRESVLWFLREYPLDLINWSVTNSHRKDIEILEPGFRGQTTREVLPPDELRIARHNANRFILDGRGEGNSEYSAGDIWLLPYWIGRYLGIVDAPEKERD